MDAITDMAVVGRDYLVIRPVLPPISIGSLTLSFVNDKNFSNMQRKSDWSLG